MEGFIGEIKMFGGNFAPRGWALCEGQLLAISDNTALFSILGTIYGGDGRTSFALPDLRGRAPVGAGQGPGLSPHRQGQRGGTEVVSLNTGQLPAHSHEVTALTSTLKCNNKEATESIGEGQTFGKAAVNIFNEETANLNMNITLTASGEVGNTGGSQPHDNMPPYLGMNYIICTQGIFPSRN